MAAAALAVGVSDPGGVPMLWPVLGVGVAALTIAGLRHWPGFACALLVRFVPLVLGWVPSPSMHGLKAALLGSLLFAAGLATAALVRRASRDEPPLATLRGVTALVLGGALGVSMLLGALSAWVWSATGSALGADPLDTLLRAWGAGASTLLIVSSLVLAWWYGSPDSPPRSWLERACLIAALAGVGLILFPDVYAPAWGAALQGMRGAAVLVPGPLMIWAGIRFGPRLCASAVAGMGLLAVLHEQHGLATDLTTAPVNDLVFSGVLVGSMAVAGYYAGAIARGARLANRAVLASHAALEGEVARRTAELRDSQGRLERAQRIARLGDWEWLAASDQTRYSAEIYRILGLPPEPGLLSIDAAQALFATSPDQGTAITTFREALRRRERYEMVLRVRGSDGRLIILDVHGDAVHGSDGAFLGMAGTSQDVTEHWELEEKLRQAQKLEAVGRLAGGIAHDFNNLLTPIAGFAELLRERLGDGPLGRDAGEIQRAAERAAALTRQLLTFSRRQDSAPRNVDLNRIVSGMRLLLEQAVGEPVELHTQLAPDPVVIRADPYQIEQVILNLVGNASEAMPRGGRVTIATRSDSRRDERGRLHGYAVLAVEDDGEGIDERAREHLFEPYFTTKEVGHGPGLGLATVYGIVEASRGEVRVEPGRERGTRFEVWLPAVASADGSPEAALPAGGETLLLAEDEPDVRAYARRVLEDQGYRVLEAPDAGIALRLVQDHPDEVDLLLTDMVMPGKSGIDLSLELRASYPDLPVLFISGHAEAAQGEIPSGPGFALVPKPFLPTELAAAVRGLLDARARDRQPQARSRL